MTETDCCIALQNTGSWDAVVVATIVVLACAHSSLIVSAEDCERDCEYVIIFNAVVKIASSIRAAGRLTQWFCCDTRSV